MARRTNKYQEPFLDYVVTIECEYTTVKLDQSARSKWEAINIAYNRFKHLSSDRKDYSAKQKRKLKDNDIKNF